jgi:hypothetical protein
MSSPIRGGSTSKALDEDLLSPGLRETQIEEEEEEAEEDEYYDEEDEDIPVERDTRLIDEIELKKLEVLQRMAEQGGDSRDLREKVRNAGASPRRQSKLKTLRRQVKKSDNRDSRLWVEVDDGGTPTGAHRPDWLTKLRGYSRDLDWSIDNFKAHPRALLVAIKDKMAAQYEYRGGLGDVPEDVFFQILRQQMRTKRSNMKRLLDKGDRLPGYVKKEHVENFKKLIAREDKKAEAERMKNVRQVVHNVSHSGRSEGEVRSRLVSDPKPAFVVMFL